MRGWMAVVFLLALSAGGCSGDWLADVGNANPLLSRLAAKSQAELSAMDPPNRYGTVYRYFISETSNLARGAEERSDKRVENAGERIVQHLVVMMNCVSDSDLESEIAASIRLFVRLTESILLGSGGPVKARKVRNLRDRFRQSLAPGRVAGWAESTQPLSSEEVEAAGWIVVRKGTETVLRESREQTRYYLILRTPKGDCRELSVTEEEFRGARVGTPFIPLGKGKNPPR
jgi:hypothetical protein